MRKRNLHVLVLAGGPDRERPVSLQSGQSVTAALRQAGHHVTQRDIGPDDLSALDEVASGGGGGGGGVVFPVLHGPWGEGGPMQEILDQRGLRYVGSRATAARLCMDKHRTKELLRAQGLPTPDWEVLATDRLPTFRCACVVKPLDEGSSIDLFICRDEVQLRDAWAKLRGKYARGMIERFVEGMELTVGVIGTGDGATALPAIRIIPATAFYDYQAKYERDDTQYVLDPRKIGLDEAALRELGEQAVRAHRAAGCRHLSRVDFIADRDGQPWILEINTLPGFTTHSLVPKAAAAAGMDLPALADRLVHLAVED